MSQIKQLNHLKIPLQAINNCTHNFNESNFLGKGGYGRVYKGILSWADYENLPVAVKRLDVTGFQGNKEFYTEVTMLSQYRHENIITLIGFCDDSKEMILVYEYASHGSLDTYLSDAAMLGELSWQRRLNICVGAVSALEYLHNHVSVGHRVIHRDIKSANILLDKNWNAKLSDFGLSRIGLANQQNTFLITNVAGTHGYCDPQYERTGILTKESDVYSLGVVLFEVLCGRLACVIKYHDERRFLNHLARTHFKNGELGKIIDHKIREHIKPASLSIFSAIAYHCLQETREERPTITKVAIELKKAMEIQRDSNLSPTEAALLIQTNFRSFMIRKNRTVGARRDSNLSPTEAALLIQTNFRSFMIRKNRTVSARRDSYLSPTDAALLIQTKFRSLMIRKNRTVDAWRDSNLSPTDAALLIQTKFRSFMITKNRTVGARRDSNLSPTDADLPKQTKFRSFMIRMNRTVHALGELFDAL